MRPVEASAASWLHWEEKRDDFLATSPAPASEVFGQMVLALRDKLPAYLEQIDTQNRALGATCFDNYAPVHIEVCVACQNGTLSRVVFRHVCKADVVCFHRVCNSIVAAMQKSGVDVSASCDGLRQRGWAVEPLDEFAALEEYEDTEEEEWVRDAMQEALTASPEAVQLLAARTSASAHLCTIAAGAVSEASLVALLRGSVEELYPAAAFVRNVVTSRAGGAFLASRALRARVLQVTGSPQPCPQLVVHELSFMLAAIMATASACAAEGGDACGAREHVSLTSTRASTSDNLPLVSDSEEHSSDCSDDHVFRLSSLSEL